MRKTIGRVAWMLLLVGVVIASASLLAGGKAWDLGARQDKAEKNRTLPDAKFTPCPVPACMGPCVYPPPPEVLCKGPDGQTEVTTFFCCCCGSGDGSSSNPL